MVMESNCPNTEPVLQELDFIVVHYSTILFSDNISRQSSSTLVLFVKMDEFMNFTILL
jgi:hypothetical protein